jgi:hypothetical protein
LRCPGLFLSAVAPSSAPIPAPQKKPTGPDTM